MPEVFHLNSAGNPGYRVSEGGNGHFRSLHILISELHQYAQHTWRVNEMQRRIDANVLLRMSQWMSQNLDK